jgi:hypothetical protein
VKNELLELKKSLQTALGDGTPTCDQNSYFLVGSSSCLPKLPSPHISNTNCSDGFTLQRGVCYRLYPGGCLQVGLLSSADALCQSLSGRLCTVPEIDGIGIVGCGDGNFSTLSPVWAALAQDYYNSETGLFGICFKGNQLYETQHAATEETLNQTITGCQAQAPTSNSGAVSAYVVCCEATVTVPK